MTSWPGLPRRRVDQVRQPATAATAPGSSSTVRARIVIVSGPADGVFVYAPGTIPALGNPPVDWLNGGSADPFGNPLPSPGSGSQGNLGWVALDNGSILLAGAGVPSSHAAQIEGFNAGNLQLTSPIESGADTAAVFQLFSKAANGGVQPEAAVVGGLSVTDTILAESTVELAAQSSTPAATPGAQLYSNATGTAAGETTGGLAGTLALTGVSTTVRTVTQAAMNPLSDAWPIPANEPNALTAYTLDVDGSGTWGTTQEVLTFQLAAFGQTLCTLPVGATQFLAGANFSFSLSCKIAFASPTTARARIRGSLSVSGANQLTNSGTVNSTIPVTAFTGLTTMTVSPAQTIELQAMWASAAVGATISSGIQEFRRSGA